MVDERVVLFAVFVHTFVPSTFTLFSRFHLGACSQVEAVAESLAVFVVRFAADKGGGHQTALLALLLALAFALSFAFAFAFGFAFCLTFGARAAFAWAEAFTCAAGFVRVPQTLL